MACSRVLPRALSSAPSVGKRLRSLLEGPPATIAAAVGTDGPTVVAAAAGMSQASPRVRADIAVREEREEVVGRGSVTLSTPPPASRANPAASAVVFQAPSMMVSSLGHVGSLIPVYGAVYGDISGDLAGGGVVQMCDNACQK
jgi:hypothetical protein